SLLLLTGLLALGVAPAAAQGHGNGHKKEFVVAPDRAVSVTREVLVHQGYEVVRIETVGNDQVVYYRRGNTGHGGGEGPAMKVVVRQGGKGVVCGKTPGVFWGDIHLRRRS